MTLIVRPRSYRIVTLGCKLNQFDSASIEGGLRARGFARAPDGDSPGVFVINTCTVTENADREARRLARRARRENPGCRLFVTGCYAERDRERLAGIEGIDDVIGHSDRHRIPEVLDALAREADLAAENNGPAKHGIPMSPEAGSGPTASKAIACIAAAEEMPALHFGERTRAFLKVQEGCDLNCSYCIIPAVRGRSRSIDPSVLEAELSHLVARGYKEIVLTGVNTGDYGKDFSPRTSLSVLLRRLLEVPGLGRLRLNSLEPRTVTDEIVGLMSDEPRLAPHLQVPLQSGCDRTLKRMYRNYRTADYRRILETLRARVPEIGLGADVIVGFPGETDAEFEETCRFVESSPLNYLHVFSYSDRPGTPASSMEGHLTPAVIHARSARLRAIGDSQGHAFRRSFLGKELEVLVYPQRLRDGRLRALSGNFIEMGIDAGEDSVNRIVSARVVGVEYESTIGLVSA